MSIKYWVATPLIFSLFLINERCYNHLRIIIGVIIDVGI